MILLLNGLGPNPSVVIPAFVTVVDKEEIVFPIVYTTALPLNSIKYPRITVANSPKCVVKYDN